MPQLGRAEDLIRGPALGPAAGVGPFGVVVAEIAVQIQPQAGLLGDEVAGKGRLLALIQDGLLDRFHTAVCLGPASVNDGMAGTELGDGGLEGPGAELLGVVAHDPLQLPAAAGQVGSDASFLLDLAVKAKDASPFGVSGGCAPVSLHLRDTTD